MISMEKYLSNGRFKNKREEDWEGKPDIQRNYLKYYLSEREKKERRCPSQ